MFKDCSVSWCAILYISHRARTFFCTCLWVMETWARKQPQGTDWPLLRQHYPCSLPRTSPHQCLLIQCVAVKPAMRDGQFRTNATEVNLISINYLFCKVDLREFLPCFTGRSPPSQRGNLSSCRTTGQRFATWCVASTVRQEHHWQMTTTSP